MKPLGPIKTNQNTLNIWCLLEAARFGVCPIDTPFDKEDAKTILSISEHTYRTAVRSGDLEFSVKYGRKTNQRLIFHNMFDFFRFEILSSADALQILEQCDSTASSLVDVIARYADITFHPGYNNKYGESGGCVCQDYALYSWLKGEYGVYADPLAKIICKIDSKIGSNLALLLSGEALLHKSGDG